MQLKLEKKLDKHIKNEFAYSFDISEKGLYAIEISARAKSWLQNTLKLISFFKDDDLAIKIDGREFPKLSGKSGLFDGEVAWNGNNLKNLLQVNVFFAHLDAGEHTLQFFVDQSPLLEIIRIYQADNEKNIVFEPVKNYQIESGDRRPWINFILISIALERLKIQASAGQKQDDDDDIQLKINGERQINDSPKSHKYWYWCGRILIGQSKTFNRELSLPAGLHYIELWADNSPILESVELVFLGKGKNNGEDISIMPYTYKGVSGNEDYNRYDAIIKEVVDYWNSEFLKDTDPPKEMLDTNLVKAIMYQESRVGYYSGAEIDVMQVGNPDDPALKTIRGELKEYWIHGGEQVVLEYADARVETVRDSIYWGVRWLYHKAQGITADGDRYWRTWKDAVYRYGPGTEEYADSIWHIYKNGIKKEKNNIIRLWIVALVLLVSVSLVWGYKTYEINKLKALVISSFDAQQQIQIQDVEIKFYQNNKSPFWAVVEWEKDWWEEIKVGMLKDGEIKWIKIEKPPHEQSILSVRFIDLKGFAHPILEIYGSTHMGNGSLHLYEVKDDQLLQIFETVAVDSYNENKWDSENYQKYGYGTCGQVYEGGKLFVTYPDINNDGMSDIVLEGKANIICEKEIIADNIEDKKVIVYEMLASEVYLWNKGSFSESRV